VERCRAGVAFRLNYRSPPCHAPLENAPSIHQLSAIVGTTSAFVFSPTKRQTGRPSSPVWVSRRGFHNLQAHFPQACRCMICLPRFTLNPFHRHEDISSQRWFETLLYIVIVIVKSNGGSGSFELAGSACNFKMVYGWTQLRFSNFYWLKCDCISTAPLHGRWKSVGYASLHDVPGLAAPSE
jgi:hypothetical protein